MKRGEILSKGGRQIASVVILAIVLVALFVWDRHLSGNGNAYASVVTLEDCQVATYFSPEGGCPDAIVALIDDAEESIDCAIYTFTSREIAQALVRAHNRGVQVRVIMDRNQAAEGYAKKRYLSKKGISVRVHIGDGIMHNKFMVVDTAIVLTGSYNWTSSANRWNYENIVIIKSPALAKVFEEQFDKLWKKFE